MVGAAGRVYGFDLYQQHRGRGKKINVTVYTYSGNVKVTVFSNTKRGIKVSGNIFTIIEESTAFHKAACSFSPEVALIFTHQLDALQFTKDSLLPNLEKAT